MTGRSQGNEEQAVGAGRPRAPGAGAIGGAGNEAGGEFRASVAAYICAHILRGQPFADFALLPEAAIPRSFTVEADAAVDDIEVNLTSGSALIQAKRRLDMTSVSAAAAQWVALVRDGVPDPERLRLVVAGAEASEEVKRLRRALERNRRDVGGGFTKGEHKALEKLHGCLTELPEEARERVLRCVVIWIADLEESDGLVAKLGQALMEPGVVAVGHGERAWNVLRQQAHGLARKRFGVTLADLVELLDREGLSLTEDGKGHAAARYRERQAKLDAYRRRVRERGENLDLGALGAALPPLPLDEIDASVSVHEVPQGPDGDEQSHNGGLAWALRRRGRALLLGLPGSGKSVALRAAAAHYAARPRWPLPIVASLQRVGGRLDSKGFGAALLEVAFENEPIEDQAALRVAAAELLRSGDAAIFLDALDESRSACEWIVSGLRGELHQCDPAVEVLLSTRDVAYAQAHTLEFRDLRLDQPERPEITVEAILRASAESRRLNAEERRAWIQARREWVQARLETDPELRETPLMIVLLTLAAADHGDAEALPEGRAAILRRVIDDVVGRWETGHRVVGKKERLGGLEGGEAVLAAKESFVLIGDQVYREEGSTLEALIGPLAKMLRERFELSQASAEVAAEEALALWDEAGVFIGEGGDRRIRTRIQLFAELAHALTICEGSEDSGREWAREHAEADEESQPLLLAAGLSEAVSDVLAERVIADPGDSRRLELCGKAIDQGARLGGKMAEALVSRLLEIDEVSADQKWDRALLLVRLPAASQRQADVFDFFDGMNEPRRLLSRALAVENWPRDDDMEKDLRDLLEADPDLFKRVKGRLGFAIPDPLYQQAILIASHRLIAVDQPEVARLVADRMRSAVSMRVSGSLRRLLLEKGFAGVVADADRRDAEQLQTGRDFATMFQESDEADRRLVEIIAGFEEPAELDRISRRRLDRLVSLIKSSAFGEAAAGDATRGVLRDADSLTVSLRTAAERGGLELSEVAAEAAEWLRVKDEESEREPFAPISMLNDGGIKLESGSWDRVSDQAETAEALARAAGSPFQWIGNFATRCLVGVRPIATRDAALKVLEETLEETTAAPQRMVALAIGLISSESMLRRFSGDDRPMVRRAAAWLATRGGTDARAVLGELLSDPDGGVRKEAAETVETLDLGNELSGEMEAATEDAEGWQCLWCGAENSSETGRCAQCELNGQLLGIPPAKPIKLAPPETGVT